MIGEGSPQAPRAVQWLHTNSEKIKQLGRQVREGDIDGAVRGVLGDGPGAQEKAAKAKELLRGLLGR